MSVSRSSMKMGPAKAGQDLKLEAFDITGLKVDVGQLGHGFGWFWKLLRCKDTMFQVSVIVRSCALAEWSLEANVGRWQFFRSSWWNQDGDEVDPRLASVVQDSLAGSASVEKAVHLEFCTGLFGCFYLLLCFVGFCFVKFCCWYLLYFVVCVLLFPMIPMFFLSMWHLVHWDLMGCAKLSGHAGREDDRNIRLYARPPYLWICVMLCVLWWSAMEIHGTWSSTFL